LLQHFEIWRKLKKSIQIEASGGLGNQLFIYAAGRFLAEKLNCELRIDLSPVGLGGQLHGISINKIGLKGDFYYSKNTFHKIKSASFRISYFISRKFEIGRRLINLTGKYYYGAGLGFDEYLQEIRAGKIIRGYFQTWKYFNPISNQIKNEIRVINPSLWYRQIEKEFLENKPIVLHIRLGDYLENGNKFGVLNARYYLDALAYISEVSTNKQIWVFSDDIELAKEILLVNFSSELNWAFPPPDSPPEESLLLMSLGSAIIIGNSTFSWWAAILNQNNPIVIAPKNWFRKSETPRDLFPPSWHLIDNFWD
jgi:hypothetical protein